MNSLDTEFHRKLRQRLDEAQAGIAPSVLSGAMDHDEYKRQCGHLSALKQVGDWCDQIESDMRQGK